MKWLLSRAGGLALRAAHGALEYDPDFTQEFGYRYAFPKPDDWVRTVALCSEPFFKDPLIDDSTDHASFWFCNLQTLYASYVSDDNDYGRDFSNWPSTGA